MRMLILNMGLDVHAQTVVIAIAEATGEARNSGSLSNDLGVLEKTLGRIKKRASGKKRQIPASRSG